MITFTDYTGNDEECLDFGETLPGIPAPTRTVYLYNSSTVAERVYVEAYESTEQDGTARDTYDATLISLNGYDYTERVDVIVPATGYVELYVLWRPSDSAAFEDKLWRIGVWPVQALDTEDLCD